MPEPVERVTRCCGWHLRITYPEIQPPSYATGQTGELPFFMPVPVDIHHSSWDLPRIGLGCNLENLYMSIQK